MNYASCSGTRKTGLCPGDWTQQCCIPASTGWPTSAPTSSGGDRCAAVGGECKFFLSCGGTTRSGLCPGSFFTQCCVSGSTPTTRPTSGPTTGPTSSRDVDILARTLYGEARGESQAGQIAVAWVIKNRSKDRRWPSTIAGVCQQPWQFSCWNSNDPNRAKLIALTDANPTFVALKGVASSVVDGWVGDPTGGANHYYATYIAKPSWANTMTFTTQIGVHRFYKG